MLKKPPILQMRLALLLLLWNDLVDSIFFGNSCGCQQQSSRGICPPPPGKFCGPPPPQIRPQIIPQAQYLGQCPPCDCTGAGIPISGGSINPTLIGTGAQFVGAGGNYATSQLIPGRGPQLIPGPNLIPGPQLGINYQTAGLDLGTQGNYKLPNLPNLFSTPRPHNKHSSRNSIDEDVYDEVIPTNGQQVADVSVDSKKLVPYDVYSKRNRFLRQLRNRALRQFSAKSLSDLTPPQFDEKSGEQPNVCNNEKLAKIMYNAMVDDITMSKKLVRKAAELAFDGKRFDVLCAIGDFSYSVYARQYCEATKGSMQQIVSRRLHAYLSKITQRRFVAAVSGHWNKPTSNTIVNFRKKIDTLNEKLVEAEREIFLRHEKTVTERQSIIDATERAICKKGKSRMIKVGSLCNNLAVDESSDIDLCFLPSDTNFFDDFHKYPDFKTVFMRTVKEQLERVSRANPEWGLAEEIFMLINARVPILVVRLSNGVNMDVQFPSKDYHTFRNTNLIRHYAAADVRFRQLYLWVKTLFIRLGIKNSKEGLLSSYHIILLVVHFLQAKTSPPVLPTLVKTHPHLVGPEIPLDKLLKLLNKPFDKLIDWKSENKRTTAELAIEFIDYYAKFNPLKDAINISKGCFPNDTRLLIYDPYSAYSIVFSNAIPDALTTAVTFIKRHQSRGSFIDSFPEFPEASSFRYSFNNKEFKGG
ncbi:Poly(A) RNA polymerase gld-2-like protein A [Aphelenchoides bicaudatus]|nr:Poly(A) RNA polymerase gld-2-like protein A [Aphelenchoides bicaudatus]